MEEQAMLWIPVTEKIPDDGEIVVVVVPCSDGEYIFRIGWWTMATQRWTLVTSVGFTNKPKGGVRYWFRLPLLPEKVPSGMQE